MVNLLFSKIDIKEAAVITPSPPSWISVIITILPKADQWIADVKVTKPVTQVADTAVKAASQGLVKILSLDEIGKINKIVPTNITARYIKRINLVGFFSIYFL